MTYLCDRSNYTISFPAAIIGDDPYYIYNQVDLNIALPKGFDKSKRLEEKGYDLPYVMLCLGLGEKTKAEELPEPIVIKDVEEEEEEEEEDVKLKAAAAAEEKPKFTPPFFVSTDTTLASVDSQNGNGVGNGKPKTDTPGLVTRYVNAVSYCILLRHYPDLEHLIGDDDWNNMTYYPGTTFTPTDMDYPTKKVTGSNGGGSTSQPINIKDASLSLYTITVPKAKAILDYISRVCPDSVTKILEETGIFKLYADAVASTDYRKQLACIVMAAAVLQRRYYEAKRIEDAKKAKSSSAMSFVQIDVDIKDKSELDLYPPELKNVKDPALLPPGYNPYA